MRKLIIIYLCTILVVFSLPVGISYVSNFFKDKAKTSPPSQSTILPKQIKVYFVDENVTKTMDLEEYIKGVLPAEVPALFHVETLKAQAVAARTYAYHKYSKFTKNPSIAPAEHKDAVVCTDSKHCNAFYTKEQLLQKHGQNWIDNYYDKMCKVVDDTRGEIMVYNDEPILAVFHSASAGGATIASKDVWGSDLPYLVSVKSVGEEQREGFVTTVAVPFEEFIKKFECKNPPKDKNKWIGKISNTPNGAVNTIEIFGNNIKGTRARELFNLKSAYFKITFDKKNVIFTVSGYGHGVGMSQYGADYMAKSGSSYVEILQNYYKGAVLKRL